MDKNSDKKGKNGDNTRERILAAAEKLFAESGFDGVAVRNITTEADCNVAAINYHFGGKDKLYCEVFRHRMVALRQIRLSSIDQVMLTATPTLEELLTAFAWAFFEPFVDENNGRGLMKLMVREMLDPHLPSNLFLEEMARPIIKALMNALLTICPTLNEEKALFSINSIVAQLVHPVLAKEMFAKAEGFELPIFDLDRLVEHIVAFSSAAIRAYAQQPQAREQNV